MKKAAAITAAVITALTMTGCVDQSGTNSKDVGESRIVATSHAAVQVCDKLELDLVGIPTTGFGLPERYRDKGICEVGGAMSPDTELIASLKPTDVIGADSLEDNLKPKYEALGLNYTFLNLRSIEGLYASIDELGAKYGREEQAQRARAQYEGKLAELEKRRSGKDAPTVMLLMGFPGSYCQATDNSYIGNLAKTAGAVNIVTDKDGEAFVSMNTEELVQCDPDYILWTAHAMPDKVAEMFNDEFKENDVWKNFRAVKEGKVIALDNALFSMSANFEWDKAVDYLCDVFYGEE